MNAVTVTFPAPLPAEIPCPICATSNKRGKGCLGCNREGKIKITVAAKIPIQRGHIVKYVADNMGVIARELSKKYGLVPNIETIEVFECENGQYEVVQISSIGGVCWVVNRVNELDTPRYFISIKELEAFKKGMMT